MSHHSFVLNHAAFDAMSSGHKTIEGRGAKPKFLRVQPGDTITFTRGYTRTKLQRTVSTVERFETFRELVLRHHPRLTASKTPDELLAFYETIYPGLPALAFHLS